MADAAPTGIATGLVHFARIRPDRRALWSDARTLTYAELEALASTLAGTLLDHFPAVGTGSRPLLPLVVGYNVESVVAVQAAARAGLAYVPIDAGSPPAFVRDLFPRLGHPAVAVITRPEQAALLPDGVLPLLVPTEPGPGADPQPVDGSDLGLVAFTSGSTGRPKGVAISWDALWSHNREILLDPDEPDPAPAALMTPLSYVFGQVRTLVPSLGCPASVIDPLALSPVDFLERFDRDRIRVIMSVPSLINSLAARWPSGRRLQHVERLMTFGEPLTWEQVPALRAILPADASIENRYGSSEAFAAAHLDIGSDQPLGTGPLPLGMPLPGVGMRLEPIDPTDPDGPREIIIAGPHMAMGYLDEPELTAARFGVDAHGTRFCRTGDIGRIGADGLYYRVGRVDDMVKIRGRLVEPSQPQQVLLAMPGVRNAVVLPQAAPDGTPRLVAHVELEPGSDLTPTVIRTALSQAVPPHLVPQMLVRHERLPLNDVGKIDRATLLATRPVPWRTAAPRPPADEFERFAMGAAGTVLGLDDVQPDDDLWELGLDSLGAVELTVILEGAGWTHLEPALLMEQRSPAALALLREDATEPSEIVWLNVAGEKPPMFCIPGGGGTAMAYRWVAAALGADQPLMVIEQRGLHSPGRPDRTVERAAGRALAHIEAYLDGQPRPAGAQAAPVTLVGYSAGGVVAYEIAAQLERRRRPVRLLLIDAPGGRTSADRHAPAGGSMVIPEGPGQAVRRAALRTWLRVFPATTVPREQRYRAYFLLSGRALRRYTPPSAAFPVTLFHLDGSSLPAQWPAAAGRMEAVTVPGNHYTMLEPPHAAGLARAMEHAISR